MSDLTQAAKDVLAERKRQVEVEGWTAEHDDFEHQEEELALAAACYVIHAYNGQDDGEFVRRFWPWDDKWWKPSKGRRCDLVKAGALILAEIERLDRASRP